jgi:hypothetical protein
MPGGVYNWAQGAVLDAADLNEFLANQVVARFADTAERTAAYGVTNAPALQAGLFAWTADNGKLSYYNGTAWEEVGAQVEDSEIVTAKINNLAVTTAKINDLAVTEGKIADSAVTSAKIADGAIMNIDVNASAAIAYSKLNLGTSIVNADVATGAAIAYSKLNLGTSIVNADVATGAAIVDTKLATISTVGKVANSATTASSAAGTNTIILRDGNGTGNFAAGKATLATVDVMTVIETASIVTASASGDIDIDFSTSPTVYYDTAASGNWTINVRGTFATTLNSALGIGQIATVTFLATKGAGVLGAYYPNLFKIDGNTITPQWMGGTTPTTGNASCIDAYTYSIIKTSGTPTYVVLASQTKFA